MSVTGLRAACFFSGAGGLDLGLKQAGVDIAFACECDPDCVATLLATLLANQKRLHPDAPMPLSKDIRLVDGRTLGLFCGGTVDLIAGGPPCQSFSTAGARKGMQDARGNLLMEYLRVVGTYLPRYVVLENVRGLLTAAISPEGRPELTPLADLGLALGEYTGPGSVIRLLLRHLREMGYSVSFQLYNAAYFGTPQSRERLVIIGCREGRPVPYLLPTHSDRPEDGLPPWRTLRDALQDLPARPLQHVTFPEDRLQYYRLLTAGQNWRALPVDLQRKAVKGAWNNGGGNVGFLRRLSWDKPSCTLVTSPAMPATDICHPDEDRPLAVEEYRRIQEFPDDWAFHGSIKSKYRQIGNAVPVGLGRAIGQAILAHAAGRPERPPANFRYSRYRGTSDKDFA